MYARLARAFPRSCSSLDSVKEGNSFIQCVVVRSTSSFTAPGHLSDDQTSSSPRFHHGPQTLTIFFGDLSKTLWIVAKTLHCRGPLHFFLNLVMYLLMRQFPPVFGTAPVVCSPMFFGSLPSRMSSSLHAVVLNCSYARRADLPFTWPPVRVTRPVFVWDFFANQFEVVAAMPAVPSPSNVHPPPLP